MANRIRLSLKDFLTSPSSLTPSSPGLSYKLTITRPLGVDELDLLDLSPEHIHTLVTNQLPESIRKKIYFNLHEWEGALWMVAYTHDKPAGSSDYTYTRRIVGSGTMVDEPVVYKNKTVRRAKVSDEMVALLVLML